MHRDHSGSWEKMLYPPRHFLIQGDGCKGKRRVLEANPEKAEQVASASFLGGEPSIGTEIVFSLGEIQMPLSYGLLFEKDIGEKYRNRRI